jgi:ArsR family transcriptional regulator
MKNFIKLMKALSDPNRVKILKMLQHQVMCVCELKTALKLAQPTVSSHLKLLEEAGLVHSRKEGLWVNYHLAASSANPYAADLLARLRTWLDQDPEIKRLLAHLPEIRREDICKK